mgnify:CR=1 FL=1
MFHLVFVLCPGNLHMFNLCIRSCRTTYLKPFWSHFSLFVVQLGTGTAGHCHKDSIHCQMHRNLAFNVGILRPLKQPKWWQENQNDFTRLSTTFFGICFRMPIICWLPYLNTLKYIDSYGSPIILTPKSFIYKKAWFLINEWNILLAWMTLNICVMEFGFYYTIVPSFSVFPKFSNIYFHYPKKTSVSEELTVG